MRVVAVQSSANTDGLTARLAEAVLQGVEDAGGEGEMVHLNSLAVEACRACGSGWGHHRRDEGMDPQQCIIDDDFSHLRKKIVRADGLVFASPVYFWDLSESAKSFLDRLRRIHYADPEASEVPGTPVVGIAAAGGSGNGASQAALNLEDYLIRWMQMKRVAIIPVTRQTAVLHREAARRAGRLLAKTDSG